MRSPITMQPAFTGMDTCTDIMAGRSSVRAFAVSNCKRARCAGAQHGFGTGTVTLAGDKLLLLRENGQLVVALASPKEMRPISKIDALPATVRAYPALADGRLYARNQKTLVCLE